MSHIVKIQTKILSKEALIKALAKCGGTFVENVGTFQFYPAGFQGDYPLPQEFTKEMLFKDVPKGKAICHHAARFENTNYEVGIIEVAKLSADHPLRQTHQENEFIVLYDFFDYRLKEKLCGANPEYVTVENKHQPLPSEFLMAYSAEVTKAKLGRKAVRMTEKVTEKQELEIVITVR